MKIQILSASLLVLAAFTTSCKSADKGATTGSSISTAANQLDLAARQLDTTVSTLNALVENPAADLVAQRKTFESALGAFESTMANLDQTATDLRVNKDAFMAEWDTQLNSIQNEDIRERSGKRREAVEASFSKANGEYAESKAAIDPMRRDMSDVRTALQSDLTMSGIDALKPSAKKVQKQAASVAEDMRELSKHFTELAAEFSRQNPAATPAK